MNVQALVHKKSSEMHLIKGHHACPLFPQVNEHSQDKRARTLKTMSHLRPLVLVPRKSLPSIHQVYSLPCMSFETALFYTGNSSA